ncbi:MAG: hypothetical protein AAGF44_02150 [Pseudomonadota bacterium]
MTVTDTNIPAQDLPKQTSLWIDSFLDAKGWKSLLNLRTGTDVLTKSKEALRKDARASAIRSELVDQLKTLKKEIADAITNRNALDPDDAFYEQDLESYDTVIEDKQTEFDELREELSIRQTFGKEVEMMRALGYDLSDLRAHNDEVAENLPFIRKELAKFKDDDAEIVDLKTLDQALLKEFWQKFNAIETGIERAFQTVVKTQKGGLEFRLINIQEYQLLNASLELAILNLQRGQIGLAIDMLDFLKDELGSYIATRTHGKKSEEDKNPDPLIEIRQFLQSLVQQELKPTADAFKPRVDAIAQIQDVTDANRVEKVKVLRAEVAACLVEAQTLGTVRKAWLTEIEAVRNNGFFNLADRAQRQYDQFVADAKIATAITAMRSHVDSLREQHDRKRARVLSRKKDVKIDMVEMESKVANAKANFEALFNKKGSQAEEPKLNWASRHVPQETIDEMRVQLAAAQQIIDSRARTALLAGGIQIEEVDAFLKNVAKEPKDLEKILTAVNDEDKRIDKHQSSNKGRDLENLLKIKERMTALKKKVYLQHPDKSTETLDEIKASLVKYSENVDSIKDYQKYIKSVASDCESRIKDLAKKDGTFTKNYLTENMEFGAQYAEAVAAIESSTVVTINKVRGHYIAIMKNQKRLEVILRMYSEAKPPKALRAIKADAKAIKTTEEKEKAKKDAYNKAVKITKSELKTTLSLFKKTRSDNSNVTSLSQELDGIETEIKATEKYATGLTRVERIKDQVKALSVSETSLSEAMDATLAKTIESCDAKLTKLRTYAGSFLQKHVSPHDDKQNPSLTDDQKKHLRSFMASILVPLAPNNCNKMIDAAKTYESNVKDLKAREKALAALRGMRAVVESFAPVKHFSKQPFDPGMSALRELEQVLPQLENKILAAAKK